MISRSTWHHLLSTVSTPGTMVSRKLIPIFYEMKLRPTIRNQGMKTSENNFYHEKYSFTFCSFTFDFFGHLVLWQLQSNAFLPLPLPFSDQQLVGVVACAQGGCQFPPQPVCPGWQHCSTLSCSPTVTQDTPHIMKVLKKIKARIGLSHKHNQYNPPAQPLEFHPVHGDEGMGFKYLRRTNIFLMARAGLDQDDGSHGPS